MKTPREILMGRHRTVEPKLDCIRDDVLSAEFKRGDASAEGPALNPVAALALTFWRELIWPCRRVWAGLACAWLLIIGLEVASFVSGLGAAFQATSPSDEDIRLLSERRRMLAQLMDMPSVPANTQKPRSPGPRSQLAGPTTAA